MQSRGVVVGEGGGAVSSGWGEYYREPFRRCRETEGSRLQELSAG